MELYDNELQFFDKFSMIVAAGENGVLGKDNDLLWHLPKDLKRFKKITNNKIIIMGKNTYQSLPIKPLPNRINVILCNDDEDFINKQELVETSNTGIIKVKEIKDVFNFVYNFEKSKLDNHEVSTNFNTDEFIIIGGGKIYELFLPYIKKLYLTKVHIELDGDVIYQTYLHISGKYYIIKKIKKMININMIIHS